jgi:hypothetical protein
VRRPQGWRTGVARGFYDAIGYGTDDVVVLSRRL